MKHTFSNTYKDPSDKWFIGFFIAWIVSAFIGLGLFAGIIYAAFHYIHKFW